MRFVSRKFIIAGLVLLAIGVLSGCETGNGGSKTDGQRNPNDTSLTSDTLPSNEETSSTKIAKYTVTFNSNGGSPQPQQKAVEKGGTVEKPKDPVKKGFGAFVGWYTDEALQNPYTFSAPVTTNLALYAKYTSAAVGNIAYNDGTVSPEPISGKTPIGIVVAVDASGSATKIVALGEESSGLSWSTQYVATGATSSTDGAANLAAVQKQAEWEKNYPAFKYCADYGTSSQLGGNWYLPAKDELNLLWTGLDAIQTGLAKAKGTPINVTSTDTGGKSYWSSTEKDASKAWCQRFGDGLQWDESKSNTFAVRPFRAFP